MEMSNFVLLMSSEELKEGTIIKVTGQKDLPRHGTPLRHVV